MTSIRFEPNGNPLSPEIKIWRYFDFLGALDLVANLRMRMTQMSLFEDGWEGRRSQAEVDENHLAQIKKGIPILENDELLSQLTNYLRTNTFVGCWTTKSPASMLMWSLYTKTPQSLALETTIGHLTSTASEGEPEVLIGKVNYGDRINGVINSNDPFYAAWSKWDHYSHEEEIRLVVNSLELDSAGAGVQISENGNFAYIKFEKQPILKIHAHPRMTSVDYENTQKIFAPYGIEINRSTISLKPDL